MPVLFVSCPMLGKPISTDVDAPEDFKARGIRIQNHSIHCPHCGAMHSWDSDNGDFAFAELEDLSRIAAVTQLPQPPLSNSRFPQLSDS
jgi:hypothetical protein